MGDEAAILVPSSTTNKVKFLCSHGGKILSRPTDNQLKYVGGETHAVSVPRDISFAELANKITTLFEGNVILKYQLGSEDLDTLVSVLSDEDLKYMLEQYFRQGNEGTSRLRAFLFPVNPVVIDTQVSPMDPQALEERYIDAINGIIRANAKGSKLIGVSPNPQTFSISSECSSPKSPPGDQHQSEAVYQEIISVNSYQGARGFPMHKVQSSSCLHNHNSGSLYPGTSSPEIHQYLHHHSPMTLSLQPHLHGYHSSNTTRKQPSSQAQLT